VFTDSPFVLVQAEAHHRSHAIIEQVFATCAPSPADRIVIMSKTFADLVAITRQVVVAFDEVERRPWTIEVTALELAKQVGDLSRRILAAEGYYLADRDQRTEYAARPEDIGDELADILYCLIRISDHYAIDLESAHIDARRREMRYVGREPNF